MRDPELFKYDVRVRDRMLRAGRIGPDEINRVLATLPDLEDQIEPISLGQPALDAAVAATTVTRQSSASITAPESAQASGEDSQEDT